MTIQHLTFEDKGQDFLWWEVDDQTGRVLGCGPHQASVWASGKCSVDMNTVAVGERPVFHGPATEPGGRFLSYRIAAIRPAETGGGVASMTKLTTELVNVVEASFQEADWSIGNQQLSGVSLTLQLEANYGARVAAHRDPMTMSLAGVRASSTGGYPGLLGNWVAAARRKLAQP
jgi:hypothetical protein